jgi:hypothetical protein
MRSSISERIFLDHFAYFGESGTHRRPKAFGWGLIKKEKAPLARGFPFR